MKKYLVGGAVRDILLGLEPKDKDYVVLGETIESMLAKGYELVGNDFPVFLHPVTKEECALARTELKSGRGYNGFTCHFTPETTFEEDAARRDLTINAMAMTEGGEVVDPFNGQQDLKDKWLRHVSPSFKEDPLRVLRLARFLARYERMGFRIHPDTMQLAKEMVSNGELEDLTPERVWKEISRALTEPTPDAFIRALSECGALDVILPEVAALKGVLQPERYHPEGDAYQHTLCVLRTAAYLEADTDTMFAALVHDLGKALTPKEKWPSHPGHEKAGIPLVSAVCDRFKVSNNTRRLALLVTEHHLKMHHVEGMRPGSVYELLKILGTFGNNCVLESFVTACLSDANGRSEEFVAIHHYSQSDYILEAAKLTRAITSAFVIEKYGVAGSEIGRFMEIERIKVLARLRAEKGNKGTGAKK